MPESESPQFSAVAPYYDLLMKGVPYRHWVRYLQTLLKTRNAEAHRVLDLACGTGNVAELLAAQEYEVVGVDLAEPMIVEARRKAARKKLNIVYHVQDAADLDLPGEMFDLCISLFDSLNYIIEPDRLKAAIARVFVHLRPGGLFIFDINSAFALEHGFFDQENTMSDDRLRYVWRSDYEAETRLCRVHMRFFLRGRDGVDQEFRETHVQFAYTQQELLDMLTAAGFTRIETFQAYTLQPVKPTTDRIFFVAERSNGE